MGGFGSPFFCDELTMIQTDQPKPEARTQHPSNHNPHLSGLVVVRIVVIPMPSDGVCSNHFDPKIIGEIRTLKDILDGVEPEKKVPRRRFERGPRAIPFRRTSNPGD